MDNRNYPEAAAKQGSIEARRLDITLRQNIDEQILQAKARVKSLEETKDRLSSSGMLDMRIDDIQQAMRW
jgi:hypothetical protein